MWSVSYISGLIKSVDVMLIAQILEIVALIGQDYFIMKQTHSIIEKEDFNAKNGFQM